MKPCHLNLSAFDLRFNPSTPFIRKDDNLYMKSLLTVIVTCFDRFLIPSMMGAGRKQALKVICYRETLMKILFEKQTG